LEIFIYFSQVYLETYLYVLMYAVDYVMLLGY